MSGVNLMPLLAARNGGIDANTLIMLQMNGADGSTSIIDTSRHNRTVSVFGNAQITTARSKFLGSSLAVDGSGAYVTVPDSDDWARGTGDLTIEAWVYLVTATNGGVICGQWSGADGFRFGMRTDNGRMYFQIFNSGGSAILDMTTTTALSNGTWTHVAVIRSGNSWNMTKDGVSVGSATSSASVANYTGVLQVASGGNSMVGATPLSSGNMSGFRISDVARWTPPFTPQAYPYG